MTRVAWAAACMDFFADALMVGAPILDVRGLEQVVVTELRSGANIGVVAATHGGRGLRG